MPHETPIPVEETDLDLESVTDDDPLSDLASLDLEKGVAEVTGAIEWIEDALSKPQ